MSARSVLADYAVTPKSVRHIASRDNDVYRVETDEGSFALRRHSPSASLPGIEAEMRWLEHLAPAMDSRVPTPIHRRDGGWITTIQGRAWTLLRWVPGRFPRKPTDRLAREMGRTLAEIHLSGAGFLIPEGAPRWDETDRFGPAFLAKLHRVAPLMEPEDSRLMLDRAEAVQSALAEHSRDCETGMLHADLYGLNCLYQSGQLAVIDFANAGAGPLAYDLAVAYRHLPIPFRPGLLRAYRSLRPLASDEEAIFPILVQARILHMAAYAADRLDHPGTYDPAKLLAYTAKSLRESPEVALK